MTNKKKNSNANAALNTNENNISKNDVANAKNDSVAINNATTQGSDILTKEGQDDIVLQQDNATTNDEASDISNDDSLIVDADTSNISDDDNLVVDADTSEYADTSIASDNNINTTMPDESTAPTVNEPFAIPNVTSTQPFGNTPPLSLDDAMLVAVNQSMSQPVNVPIPATLDKNGNGNNKKPKEKMSKHKKRLIALAVLIAVVVIGITLAIAIPLVNFYKDKVIVNSADDFVYESGKYFVLTKDINIDGDLDLSNMPCNIDFNKHTLTISGKFIVNTDTPVSLTYNDKDTKTSSDSSQTDKTPKKEIKRGTINANTLQIFSPNTTFVFGVNIVCQNFSATAKDISVLYNFTNSNANATTFENCPSVVTSGTINAQMTFINSSFVQQSGSANSLVLDNDSTAQIFGEVKDNINGGKKVAILGYAGNVTGAQLVATTSGISVTNCGHIVLIDTLERTADVVVEKRADNKFVAVVAQSFNAQKYAVEINGKTVIGDTNQVDISEALSTLNAGKYQLSAYAVGNFNFETLSTADSIVYYNGAKTTIEYTHTITLNAPQNVKIEAKDNKIILSFDRVNFATKYTIFCDGYEVHTIKDKGQENFTFDVTQSVESIGTHSFKVVAHSKNKQIDDSLAGIASYTSFKTLDKPANLACQYENGKIILNWTGNNVAKSYRVYILKENGETIQLGMAVGNSFFTNYTTTNPTDKICVYAEGFGCFKQSEMVSTFVLPQAPIQP